MGPGGHARGNGAGVNTMQVTFSGKIICDGAACAGQTGKFIGPLGTNTVRTSWDQAPRKYIGAKEAVPANTGNAVGEYPLQVGVEFATVGAAQMFAYSWAAGFGYPAEGKMVITGDDGDTETFPKASLADLSITQSGCFCLVAYKFTTGADDQEE